MTATRKIDQYKVESAIYLIRGRRVMLDSDLAAIYGTSTMRLNEQFRRNRNRFPEDFAFVLTREEFSRLISQIAISKKGRGGRRKPAVVFTEHGAIINLFATLKRLFEPSEPPKRREIGSHARERVGRYRVHRSKIENPATAGWRKSKIP